MAPGIIHLFKVVDVKDADCVFGAVNFFVGGHFGKDVQGTPSVHKTGQRVVLGQVFKLVVEEVPFFGKLAQHVVSSDACVEQEYQ